MKKVLFSCIMATLTLCSCMPSLSYQIANVKSPELQLKDNKYTYENQECKITYNFWAEGGNPGFTIYNLTDEIMTVDLAKSFLICNNYSNNYYQARETRQTVSTTNKTTGAAFGLLGSSSTVRTVNSDVTTIEQPTISIAPKSCVTIHEYKIAPEYIEDCNISKHPRRGMPSQVSYSYDNSPVRFSNYITYSVGATSNKVVENKFYISGLGNYTDATKYVRKGCNNERTVVVNKYEDPCNFFTSSYYY